MSTLRLLLTDRLNSGILAAFLTYALLVQSVAGGIASARMTRTLLAHSGVDCTISVPLHSNHGDNHRLACCTTLCQIACGSAAGFPHGADGASLGPVRTACLAAAGIARSDPSHPRRLGICREARAPPHLST